MSNAKSLEKSFSYWSSLTGVERGRLLYKLSLEIKNSEASFLSLIKTSEKCSKKEARETFKKGYRGLLYFTGFCDKFTELASSSDFVDHSFKKEVQLSPVGPILLGGEDSFSFERILIGIGALLSGGNSIVVKVSLENKIILEELKKFVINSGLPDGIVHFDEDSDENILSKKNIKGLYYLGENQKVLLSLKKKFPDKKINAQRENALSLRTIIDYINFKTIYYCAGP